MSQAQKRLDGYTKDIQGRSFFKRSAYPVLNKYIKDFVNKKSTDPRIIIMPGLRGTGKTTLLAQLFLDQPLKDVQKVYLSIDEIVKRFEVNLWDVIDHFEEINGMHLEEMKEPLLLFLDEVHYDPKWASFLKSLYDRSKNVLVVCTGSAALLLREQINADIARRAIFLEVHPVNFTEYLLLKDRKYPVKGLGEELRQAVMLAKNAKESHNMLMSLDQKVKTYWRDITHLEIQRYIKLGTFPFTIHSKNEALALDYVGQMLNKVTFTDIPQFASFEIDTLNRVEKMLYILSSSIGISVTQLGQTIETKAHILNDLLAALEKAGLLLRVMPYGAHTKQVRKPSKYLFATPAIRYFFLSSRDSIGVFENYQGHLFEDITSMYFNKILEKFGASSLTYDVAKGGADFILMRGEKKIVVEVGAGEKKTRQVISTMQKVKSDYGLILHSGNLSLDEANNIVSIPWRYFLLM